MKKELNPNKGKKAALKPSVQRSREMLLKIFNDEIESGRFKAALDKLETKDYLRTMMKLMPFIEGAEYYELGNEMPASYFSSLIPPSEN